MREHPDGKKSQLAVETCEIAQRTKFCTHQHCNATSGSAFIDWYLILRVEEDASADTIRKQYHKLALLLHPDKNSHPKAEIAFKLVSQAYSCLSDNAKRTAFNSERRRSICTEHKHTTYNNAKKSDSTRNSKFYRTLIAKQLQEDAKIIESCLKVNRNSRSESPVFNPANYVHKGYPHPRSYTCKRDGRTGFTQKRSNFCYDQRKGRCESPVFELKTDTVWLRSS